MRVRLARTAGFCMGVRRAMELALAAGHGRKGPVATHGPLIHNPQVLSLLQSMGVCELDPANPLTAAGGTVIIRAHGVPRAEKQALREMGLNLVDGTCPKVMKVAALSARAARQGADLVIVGEADHPEVKGILGYAGESGHVVSGPKEVAALPELKQVVVVAQTTQSQANFAAVIDALTQRFGPPAEVHNTICGATNRRQEEAGRLACEVDAMVVVGGRASANTKRLAEVAARSGKPVFLVENENELDLAQMAKFSTVGITAGASTPNWMIKRVVQRLVDLRSAGESALEYYFRKVYRFVVRSQLLVAAGAAGMTLACALLQGFTPNPAMAGISFLYIYAMHILNNFLDSEAQTYNDPDRTRFVTAHRSLLMGAGVFSALAAVGLAAWQGALPLFLVGGMIILGLLYSVPLLPPGLVKKGGPRSLKDIPGSKTVSAASAWALMAAVLPALEAGRLDLLLTPAAAAVTFGLALVRYALFDIMDTQGDLIVGKETIPIVLGESATRGLLAGITLAAGLLTLAAVWPGGAGAGALVLLIPAAGLGIMQVVFSQAWMAPSAASEGLVDLNFFVVGLAAAGTLL